MSEGSAEIDALVDGLGDWRGHQPADIRRLSHEAVPDVVGCS